MVAFEDDLIDAYVRGEIPLAQRSRFEDQFFSSERRRRKVEFAQALATVTSEEVRTEQRVPVIVAQTPRENALVAFFRSLRPITAFSYAVIALLIAVGAVWLIPESIRL